MNAAGLVVAAGSHVEVWDVDASFFGEPLGVRDQGVAVNGVTPFGDLPGAAPVRRVHGRLRGCGSGVAGRRDDTGTPVASGVYFVRLDSAGVRATERVTLRR